MTIITNENKPFNFELTNMCNNHSNAILELNDGSYIDIHHFNDSKKYTAAWCDSGEDEYEPETVHEADNFDTEEKLVEWINWLFTVIPTDVRLVKQADIA